MAVLQCITSLLVLFLIFVSCNAQNNCTYDRSREFPNSEDVSCNCMQQFRIEFTGNINTLTVNLTGCEEKELELNWSQLQAFVRIRKIVFVGVIVSFSRENATDANYSIEELYFSQCNMLSLPEYAFEGLPVVQKIQISDSDIQLIKQNAFSTLHNLNTVEIINSNINIIAKLAFNNLYSFNSLFLVRSRVGRIESEAIQLLAHRGVGVGCGEGRSLDAIENILGRSNIPYQNISLPEGSKIFIFESSIDIMQENAIQSNLFSYCILGGSTFVQLHAHAFKLELRNECDISGFLAIENEFQTVSSKAFASVSGTPNTKNRTFMVLSGNAFVLVRKEGFIINDNITVVKVEDNTYDCSCNNFEWIHSKSSSPAHIYLEEELLKKSLCSADGTPILEYLVITCGMSPDAHHTTSSDTGKGSATVSGNTSYLVFAITSTISMILIYNYNI